MRLVQINRAANEAGKNKYTITSDLPPSEVIKRPYAIMSHTWSTDEEEYLFDDFQKDTGTKKTGYQKFKFCGEQAARDGYDYFWIDTVCIDKTNLVELDKALNSMFRWYRDSEVCYVYLSDVSARSVTDLSDYSNANLRTWRSAFRTCRWWTRGWTLQEFIAPRSVVFYSVERMQLGTKERLQTIIHEITNIPKAAFLGQAPLSEFSITERLSWASGRQTKEEEDEAYCLLGIFDIYMRPTYGIGKKALIKLREKLEKLNNPAKNQSLELLTLSAIQSKTDLNQHNLTVYDSSQPHGVSSKSAEANTSSSGGLKNSYNTCLDLLNYVEDQLNRQPDSDRWHAAVQFKSQKKKLEELAAKTSRFQSSSLLASSVIENLLNSISEQFDENELKRFHLGRTNTVSGNTTDQNFEMSLGTRKMSGFESFEKSKAVENSSRWSSERRHGFATNVNSFTDIVKTLQDMIGGPSDVVQSPNQELVYMEYHIQSILEGKRYQYQQHVREEVISWLGMASFDQQSGVFKHYENQLSSRLSGTCEWIFSDDQYISWASNDFPEKKDKIIWINGGPGFGKSVLCAKVIEKFKVEFEQETLVGFFFSSPHAASSDDLMFIVKSWLAQLIANDEKTLAIAHDCFNDSKELVIASESTLWKVLKTILTDRKGIALFLDGFDEYSRTNNVRAKFLHDLKYAASKTATRIFITSREEPEFKPEISPGMSQTTGETLFEVKITKETVSDDVKLFSHSVVNKKLPGKDQVLKDKLASQLADKCEGMFLWIKLQEEQLRGGKNGKKLEKIVQNMPSGLTSTYERNWNAILNRGDSEDKDRAFAILRWTMLSLRPLSIAELSQALTIKVSAQEAHSDLDELPDEIDDTYIEEEIVDLCGALVQVRNEKGISDPGSRTIHLIHASVREFLQSVLPAISENNIPSASLDKHHDYLARTCLAYLNDASRDSGSNSNDFDSENLNAGQVEGDKNFRVDFSSIRESQDRKTVQISQQFLDYALVYWSSHMSLSGEKENATWLAAFNGHAEVLKVLIERGADISAPCEYDVTPIYLASGYGHVACVELLIASGVDVKGTETGASTSICNAARYGHTDVVICLVEAGVNINVQNKEGYTALYQAVINSEDETAAYLIEAGADLSIKCSYNLDTALLVAADRGNLKLVELLVTKGASLNERDKSNQTPIRRAAYEGHTEIFKFLYEQGADVMIFSADGYSPLTVAASRGHFEIVKYLQEQGADINLKTVHDASLLYLASSWGNLPTVELLLANNADHKAATKSAWTPLHIASQKGHLEIVKLLLQKGANIEARTVLGQTPLSLSCVLGTMDAVLLLLEHGADIAAPDNHGNTALCYAAVNGHIDLARELFKRGADPSEGPKHTPLCQAASKGHVDMIKFLLDEAGVNPNKLKDLRGSLLCCAMEGGIECVRLIIEKGMDLSVTTQNGWTAVHQALWSEKRDILKLLLEKGADCNGRDQIGRGPLRYAVSCSRKEMITLLLENGADPMVVQQGGQLAVHLAARIGDLEILKLMMEPLADEFSKDTSGRNLLHHAAVRGETTCIEYLIEKGFSCKELDNFGKSVFQYACMSGSLDVVKLILKYEAVPEYNSPWSPLHWAYRNGTPELVDFIEKLGMSSDPVKTTQPAWTWTPKSIAQFHHNSKLELGSVDLNADSKEKETRDPSKASAKYPAHEKHSEYICDHCFNVRFIHIMQSLTNSDRIFMAPVGSVRLAII